MTEYECNSCGANCKLLTTVIPTDCVCCGSPAEWIRVAEPVALEAESIIHGYTFRAQETEINSKADVNEVIKQLQDCITDLISLEWPEDKERVSRLLQVKA